MANDLFNNLGESPDGGAPLSGQADQGQSFATGSSAGYLSSLNVDLLNGGTSSTGAVTAYLYGFNNSTTGIGSEIAKIGTVQESSLSNRAYVNASFIPTTAITLAANTSYYIVLTDPDNQVDWQYSSSVGGQGVAGTYYTAPLSRPMPSSSGGAWMMEVAESPALVKPAASAIGAGAIGQSGNVFTLAGDTSADNGFQVLSVNGQPVGEPVTGTYGGLMITAQGVFNYTPTVSPSVGHTYTDTFQLELVDNGQIYHTTFSETLYGQLLQAPLGLPTVNATQVAVNENSGVNAGNILTASFDQASTNSTLTVTAANGFPIGSGGQTIAGAYGTLSLLANGQYTYDPTVTGVMKGQSVTDNFSYDVLDQATGISTVVPLAVTIKGVTPPPTVTANAVAVTYTGAQPVPVDAGLTVSTDGTNVTGATVSITQGFLYGDMLNFKAQNGISGTYVSNTGQLTLSGAASAAAYQSALSSITFSSGSADPENAGADTSRAITFQVTGTGGTSAVTDTITVNVPPVLSGADPRTFVQAGTGATGGMPGAAVAVDDVLSVADHDSMALRSATVQITNGVAGDELRINGLTQGSSSGIIYTYNAATYTLKLTGTASLAAYQSVLHNVTFDSTSANPTSYGTNTSRAVTFTAFDGTDNTNTFTTSVTVQRTDQPPVLSGVPAAAMIIGGQAGTALASAATMTDADDTTLAGATLTESGYVAGDTLNFALGGLTWVTVVLDNTQTLTLSGSASLATYQQLLDGITFSATNTTAPARSFTWTVTDPSGTQSASQTETVSVAVLGPVITTSSGTASFVAGDNTASTPVPIDPNLTIADAQTQTLQGVTVTITNQEAGDIIGYGTTPLTGSDGMFTTSDGSLFYYTRSGDALTFEAAAPPSASAVAASSGASYSLAEYQALLQNLTYTNSQITPDPTTRTIDFQAVDSNGQSGAVAARNVTMTDTD